MPVPVVPVPWVGSLLWLLGTAAVAFAVSEVAANVYRLGRRPYIAVLTWRPRPFPSDTSPGLA